MGTYAIDDSALQRENRRVALGTPLALSRRAHQDHRFPLTGLTRNRLETLRRRLGVPGRTRRRGPTPSSLRRFLQEPVERSEGAAFENAICAAFGLPAIEREWTCSPTLVYLARLRGAPVRKHMRPTVPVIRGLKWPWRN